MAKTAKKKEETVSLETVLWNCRVALRGVGSTDKNRDAVIGLCFLKFAGDKFEKRRAELIAQYGDIPAFLEKASFYNAVNVFYEYKWGGRIRLPLQKEMDGFFPVLVPGWTGHPSVLCWKDRNRNSLSADCRYLWHRRCDRPDRHSLRRFPG